MSQVNVETRIRQAEENWQRVRLGDPLGYDWGFFSYGDAPAALGGGYGMFCWFASSNAMYDFIASTLPYDPPGPQTLDSIAVADETRKIIGGLKSGDLDQQTGVVSLNQCLRGFSQIEWLGEFSSLLESQDSYAIQVRAAFRESNRQDSRPYGNDAFKTKSVGSGDVDASGAAITTKERVPFSKFLDQWGA